MNTWKKVTKEEALEFIANYPNRLTTNYFMDSYSWHDFTEHRGSASIVVMADLNYDTGQPDSWRINTAFLAGDAQ